MKIEIDPKDLLSRENFQLTRNAAKEEGIPLEVYVFKTYDLLMTSGVSTPINVNDTLIPQKVEIVHAAPKPATVTPKAEASAEPKREGGKFDHLNLLEEGKAGTRAHNLLEENFDNVAQFLSTQPDDILKIKGFGQKSLDLIVERLVAGNHITSAAEIGASDYDEDDDYEDEDDDDYEDDDDAYAQLRALDVSMPESIPAGCRLYMEAWKLDYEVAQVDLKVILDAAGYKKTDDDSIRFGVLAILDAMPLSGSQQAKIMKLGSEIGEAETSTRERAIAMCGKEFDMLTYGEALTLIEEMEEDLNQGTVVVDENFTF